MINRIVMNGRLTADVEVRYTQSGVAVCNFTLAVDRSFRREDGGRDCDFIPCVAWRGLAETIGKYCKKAKRVGVDGSLQMRKYQTQEGENRTVYEVLVDRLDFLDSARAQGDAPAEDAGAPAPPASDGGGAAGDLPF